MTRRSLVWTFPFISFIIGYWLANYFFASASFPTPAIVGLALSQGAKVLSDHQLNIRIIGEKIDATVKPETIVHQQPNAGLGIKAHQTVYIVIAQAPANPQAPTVTGLTRQQTEELLSTQGITGKWYPITCNAPDGTIVAQDPTPGSDLPKAMVMYQAIPREATVIMPNLIGRTLNEVSEFLQRHQVPYNAVSPHDTPQPTSAYTVREQRPLAGSLITLRKPPTVQLLVEESTATPPQIPLDTPVQTEAM